MHDKICRILPPIIGVLNGAMVLRDVTIKNMSYEQLMDVTGPKVLGSVYLDRIFDHQDLDFFLFISSICGVMGNPGQANYAAANMFMCAMAANRRKRGLAGSAVNVGTVIGSGFMEIESSKALDRTVSKLALMPLSERDFHQLIAEGVEASRPGAVSGPEITTGILDVNADADDGPLWCKDPRFLYFIRHQTSAHSNERGKTELVSIPDLLGSAKTEGELLKAVQGWSCLFRTQADGARANDSCSDVCFAAPKRAANDDCGRASYGTTRHRYRSRLADRCGHPGLVPEEFQSQHPGTQDHGQLHHGGSRAIRRPKHAAGAGSSASLLGRIRRFGLGVFGHIRYCDFDVLG